MDCYCGSGLTRRPLFDARGIYCANVCDKCEARRRAEFKPEIFVNPSYDTDGEPVDGEFFD